MSNVLVIGDTHCPCMLDGYIDFLKYVEAAFDCDTVVHIGDLVDWASISYHERTPSISNAKLEYEKAYAQVQELYAAFPKVTWVIGNHDALSQRQATTAGIPDEVLRPYNELWGVPDWEVVPRYDHAVIDGVMYQHGDRGKGGQMAAFKNAKDEFRPVVQGHHHAQAGVAYSANERDLVWGLNVGCGVDHHLESQSYGKRYNAKPIVGCGVVQAGTFPAFVPMIL